ncbi:MAG: carboxypeptidase regulatory-like domain-containing protein [Algibacter sp.]
MKTKFSGMLTLLLALAVQLSFAQNKTVSGIVSDASGLPLPETTVLVKGTSYGTSTDFDGRYSIFQQEYGAGYGGDAYNFLLSDFNGDGTIDSYVNVFF